MRKTKPSTRENEDGQDQQPSTVSEDIDLLTASQLVFRDDISTASQEQENTQKTSSDNRDEESPTRRSVEGGTDTSTAAPVRNSICSFYRKGTCRYGASGRGCPKEHPKPCKKLLQNGTKAPHGCTLGRDRCDKFHPKMCPSSIRKGECFNSNCRMRHVQGTKRKPPTDIAIGEKELTDTMNSNARGTTTSAQTNSDFLESMRLFKAEILESVRTEIAVILSTITPAAQNPSPPSTVAANTMGPPQTSVNPQYWTNPAAHMTNVNQWPQVCPQPYNQSLGPYLQAPQMYLPGTMTQVLGAQQQQPMYPAATTTGQSA